MIIRVINHHHHNHYHYHKASERKWPNRTKEEEEEEEEQKNKQNDVKAGVQQTVCVQYIKVLLLLPRLNWTGKGKSPTPAGTRRLFIHFLFFSLSLIFTSLPPVCHLQSLACAIYFILPHTAFRVPACSSESAVAAWNSTSDQQRQCSFWFTLSLSLFSLVCPFRARSLARSHCAHCVFGTVTGNEFGKSVLSAHYCVHCVHGNDQVQRRQRRQNLNT